MNFKEYADKVRACWLGKNIGGTLGCPLEGTFSTLTSMFTIYVPDRSPTMILTFSWFGYWQPRRTGKRSTPRF